MNRGPRVTGFRIGRIARKDMVEIIDASYLAELLQHACPPIESIGIIGLLLNRYVVVGQGLGTVIESSMGESGL